jgi:SAM-dependent methyltransferase
MHLAAYTYVADLLARQHFAKVVEIGGRDINGGVRGTFTCDAYTSLDLEPGPGVDVVADCQAWTPPEPVDLVLVLEVLEHAPDQAGVIRAAISYLAPGGRLVITAGGPGRAPHSGHDGGALAPGEHYGNLDPDDLRAWLSELKDVDVVYAPGPCDVYGTGVKA